MVSITELKEKSIKQLGGNIFTPTWLLNGLITLIYAAALSISNGVSIVIGGPLEYGVSKVFINNTKETRETNIWQDLVKGFTETFLDSFLLGLMQSIFIFLWSLLFIVPGIIKSYSYSMAFFIQQDGEEKGWRACLNKSKQMMNGYKWKLFVLDLSFIGWYILGGLCFGVGTFFVMPYHMQTRANFYKELIAKSESTETVA